MQRNAIKIFLLLTALLLAYVYGKSIFILASHHFNTDIMLAYLSGKMLNAHTSGYHFSQAFVVAHDLKTNIIANLSPPFSVIFMALIARYFSYVNFFAVFTISTLCLNIWALTRLYQHFYSRQGKYYRTILTTFILANLFYWPTFMNITFGQVALILNALIIFSYLSLEKKHHFRAGFLLAIAINIKLFFGIFLIHFIAKKQYRAFFSFLVCSVLIALIPVCFYGKSIYQGYFEALKHIQWYGINWNASWYGFFSRILGETSHRFHSALYMPKLSKSLYYFFFIIYIGFIFYFNRKNSNTPLTFSFTLSSMLLLSPLGWSYYFPILVTALLINILTAEKNRYYVPFICLLMFSLFLSALPFSLYQDTNIKTMTLISQGNLFFIALLLFNTINLLQLIFQGAKNNEPILTQNFKIFIFSICLLPSIIGMSGIVISLAKNKTANKESTTLAFANDLLPSKTN